MKTILKIGILLLMMLPFRIFSQTQNPYSKPIKQPGAKVIAVDQYGNEYTSTDLATNKKRATIIVTAGLFRLYFDDTYYDINRRNCIIQVCSDLSVLLGNTIRTNPTFQPSTTKYIEIAVNGYNDGGSISLASSKFLYSTKNTAISPTAAQEYLMTGIDPFYNGSSIYHGILNFNFAYNFSTDLQNKPSTGYTDLYTVALHELTHVIGFTSNLSTYNPKLFTIWDTFLEDELHNKIVTTSNDNYSAQINPAVNINDYFITNSTKALNFKMPITSTLIPIYIYTPKINTPPAFEAGSSFSHFGIAAANSYVMSTGTGPVETKRYLRPDEINALKVIGLQLTNTYGNGNAILNFTGDSRFATATPNQPNTIITYSTTGENTVTYPYAIDDYKTYAFGNNTMYTVNAGSSITISDFTTNSLNCTSIDDVFEIDNTLISQNLCGGNINFNLETFLPGSYLSLSNDKKQITYSPDALESNHIRTFIYNCVDASGKKSMHKAFINIQVIGQTVPNNGTSNLIVNGDLSKSNYPRIDGRDYLHRSMSSDIIGWKEFYGGQTTFSINDGIHSNSYSPFVPNIALQSCSIFADRVYNQLNNGIVALNDLYVFRTNVAKDQTGAATFNTYLNTTQPTKNTTSFDLQIAQRTYPYQYSIGSYATDNDFYRSYFVMNSANYKYIILETTAGSSAVIFQNLNIELTDNFTVSTTQDKQIVKPNSTVNSNLTITFDSRCLAQKYPFTISLTLPTGVTLAANNYFNANGSSKKTYPAGTFSPTSPNNVLNIPLVFNTDATTGDKNITINYSFQSSSNTVTQSTNIEFNVQSTTACLTSGTNHVYNSSTGTGYPTIQSAITAANPGNTLLVCSGTYTENLTIGIPLTISSYYDGTNPTINASTILSPASATIPAISITSPNVHLIGFTIQGTGNQLGLTELNSIYEPENNLTLSNMVLNNLNTPLQIRGSNINISNTLITNCNTNFEIVNSAVVIDNLNYYKNSTMPLFVLNGNSSISNSSFNNNINSTTSLQYEIGIHNGNNILINLSKCRFKNNSAVRIINYSNGSTGPITLDSCCFINNFVTDRLFLISSTSNFNNSINNCLFQNNSSTSSLYSNLIYNNTINGSLSLNSCTITGNSGFNEIINIDGGANIISITGCTISNNTFTNPTNTNACINGTAGSIQNFSFINSTIQGNTLVGIYLINTINITLNKCSITNCSFNSLYLANATNLTIKNDINSDYNIISNNNGNISLYGNTNININQTRIENNSSSDGVSGIYMMMCLNVNIRNSKFYKNTSISNDARVIQFNSTDATLNIENSLFIANKRINWYVIAVGKPNSDCQSCTNSSFTLNHVTILDNELSNTARVLGIISEKNLIKNSILWDNATLPAEIDNNYSTGTSQVINSTIRYGVNGISTNWNKTFNSAPNNVFSFQPEFLALGDYRPTPDSKIINAGVLTTVTTDIDGNTRDNQPDLGAYEYKVGGATVLNTFPIADATITNAAGCGMSVPYPSDQNNGASQTIAASYTPASYCVAESWQKTLIRFDLRSIPANAIITKATFTMVGTTSSNPNLGRLRKVSNLGWSWAENSVTWNSINQSFYSTTEVIPVTTTPTVMSDGVTRANATIDVTRFVTFWYRNMDRVNNPINATIDQNYGMLYELDPSITTNASNYFGSTNNTNTLLKPTLTVEYIVPQNPSVIIVNEDAMISNFGANGYSEYNTNFINRNNEVNFAPGGYMYGTTTRRSLEKIDLSSVTATSVKSAILQLAPINNVGTSNAETIKVITSAWNPSTVTWTSINTATTPTNMVSIPAQTGVANPNVPVYADITAIVNSWLSNSVINNGIMIQLANEVPSVATNQDFASMENDNPAYHPRLLLDYDVPNWTGIIKSELLSDDATVSDSQSETVPKNEPLPNVTKEVTIYPIPSHNEILIDASNLSETIQHIEIIDMVGKIMQTITPSEFKTTVDISAYSNGIYFVKLNTATKSISGKFIKD